MKEQTILGVVVELLAWAVVLTGFLAPLSYVVVVSIVSLFSEPLFSLEEYVLKLISAVVLTTFFGVALSFLVSKEGA